VLQTNQNEKTAKTNMYITMKEIRRTVMTHATKWNTMNPSA